MQVLHEQPRPIRSDVQVIIHWKLGPMQPIAPAVEVSQIADEANHRALLLDQVSTLGRDDQAEVVAVLLPLLLPESLSSFGSRDPRVRRVGVVEAAGLAVGRSRVAGRIRDVGAPHRTGLGHLAVKGVGGLDDHTLLARITATGAAARAILPAARSPAAQRSESAQHLPQASGDGEFAGTQDRALVASPAAESNPQLILDLRQSFGLLHGLNLGKYT